MQKELTRGFLVLSLGADYQELWKRKEEEADSPRRSGAVGTLTMEATKVQHNIVPKVLNKKVVSKEEDQVSPAQPSVHHLSHDHPRAMPLNATCPPVPYRTSDPKFRPFPRVLHAAYPPRPACLSTSVSSSTPVERDERLLQRTNKPRRLFLLSLDLALSDPYSYSYSHSLLLSPSSQIPPPPSAVPISSC
ncbi:hypothetical protein CNYM01_12943 [Colletotrichum nymphaeae SA-01]|uniref:Uncharacterized protein n=1 Tax=Colletotrichum nymphaeae SA-01 TaxID=1460502 RepID=A0A135S138_9PEZI|nr:hypothetical protein CNYM01_12943 [Colletotrichum nymphaeae SA-01]